MRGALVVLVGADGAGKTTLARRLVATVAFPAAYVYMGDNPEACEEPLPTTRWLWWLRRRSALGRRHGDTWRALGRGRRLVSLLVDLAVLCVQMAEEAHQLARARRHLCSGRLVVADRYFPFDYHAHAHDALPGGRAILPRLHAAWLAHLFPHPDLSVCLDAGPEVLLARRGGEDASTVAKRRQEYLDLAVSMPGFVVVDATRCPAEVEAEVVELLSSLSPAGAGSVGAEGLEPPTPSL